jgi:hypothetical protein
MFSLSAEESRRHTGTLGGDNVDLIQSLFFHLPTIKEKLAVHGATY